MTAWSSGFHWEPSGQLEPSLWEGVDAGVGFPGIILDRVDVTDRCTGASWSRGRTWWLADPEPGTASLELQGSLAGELAGLTLGDTLVITADPVGTLWTGWVDSIAEVTDPVDGELQVGLSITAADAMSRLLSVELYASLVLPAATLDVRLAALANAAGVPGPQVVRVLPTTGVLPQLAAVTLTGSSASPLTLGDHLARCERASNAITAVDMDGSWLVLPRARVTTTPVVVDLDDDSDPNHLQRTLATPDRVRNVFTIASSTEQTYPASIAKYGRHAYDVPAGVATTAPPYAPETLAAFAEPAAFAQVVIPVRHRTAAAVGLSPFDWARISIRPDDEYYQALALAWRAEPDDWELTVDLDRTQMTIAAPPIDPDPPNPIPPTTATVTDTFVCDRSAYVVQTGSINAGNGASADVLVGRLGDGNLARGLLRFAISWRGKRVTNVASAKLRLYGADTTCSAFGSSPSTTVSRVTGSWSPGTYATRCGFASGNAAVYPGPPATSAGAVTKGFGGGTGILNEVGIGDIARAWASGSPNYGVQLRGASESSSSNRAPYWSKTGSKPPVLVVTYTYEV